MPAMEARILPRTVLFIIAVFFASVCHALEKPGDELQEVGIDYALGNQVDLELQFTDINGEKVQLKDLTQGKPTIFIPVY